MNDRGRAGKCRASSDPSALSVGFSLGPLNRINLLLWEAREQWEQG